uniref:AP-5 complex subunit beta n=2 Tax=Anthurium amnicola TaxID=1678845 RepID=A0A1D1XYH7_9ARAE
MEKQPSLKQPPPPQPPSQQVPSPQEWEALIEDFQSGSPSRQSRWLAHNPTPLSLLDLALASILRRDFPSKSLLLLFLEESAHLLVPSPPEDAAPALTSLVDALRAVVQSPADAAPAAFALKEQMMVAVTSVAITVDALDHAPRHLEALVELLLAVVNRPNHGPDRQTRAVACECLRELEKAYPCLLSEISGHLWNLCQSERTHVAQSYILLLTSVVHNMVQHSVPPTGMGILSTSVQLIPFNAPAYLTSVERKDQDLSEANLRDIRRVMAFLLERPLILTPLATAEMVFMLTCVVKALEAQMSAAAALLKVQFSGLIYSYDPMLSHVVLMLYSHFSDVFSGDEQNIIRRLTVMSKEAQQPLVFRLLALHWLLGVVSRPPDKKSLLVPMAPSFYPSIFDPLGLKAAKLDVLAFIAVILDFSGGEKGKKDGEVDRSVDSVAKLFEDSLVCVSAFRWLPPWSTETLVAFRTLHKFLTGAVPHSSSDDSAMSALIESTTFCSLQSILVNLAVEHRGLVLVIAALVDRLRGCEIHKRLGECLLQTFDECLLPKLVMDYRISAYFPIFERIAENDKIPPRYLLELLLKFMVSIVEKHGPDTRLRSWSQGSRVLRLCRTVLMNHSSSRIFNVLSRLLSFTSQFFPDLEVRDNARIYLRMLVCIPGKKLRHLLNLGEQLQGVAPSPHVGLFYQVPSPRSSHTKQPNISSYIHLERVIPLLVKQSWSLIIPYLGPQNDEPVHLEGLSDAGLVSGSVDVSNGADGNFESISSTQEPLRVMDSKNSEILHILRRHFSCIPDLQPMKGLKIKIACKLRFDAGIFSHVWGTVAASEGSDETHGVPALYAIVLRFSSTSKYGSIPSCRVPFLLGEPSVKDRAIVPVENTSLGHSRSSVTIELEPREPMPGLIDVTLQANTENGQTISGSLQSIPVGIEDMFLKASIPYDASEDDAPHYYLDLFNALWEACGSSANTGRETFPLKGGKGAAAINGTGSVKLLEVSADSLISAVECHLAPFVVSVAGGPLVDALKGNGTINNAIWKEESVMPTDHDVDTLMPFSGNAPLQIQYIKDEEDADDCLLDIRKTNLGSFFVLIFLPPRFHLLFQMEVHDTSTLVRIRTDHWPCLAYVDEYLESLFLT